jgi:hypothetical protein
MFRHTQAISTLWWLVITNVHVIIHVQVVVVRVQLHEGRVRGSGGRQQHGFLHCSLSSCCHNKKFMSSYLDRCHHKEWSCRYEGRGQREGMPGVQLYSSNQRCSGGGAGVQLQGRNMGRREGSAWFAQPVVIPLL